MGSLRRGTAVCLFALLQATLFAQAGAVAVSPGEHARWLRWLIPLPKRISIDRKLTLPAGDVGLRLRKGAGEVEQTAAGELRALFKDKAGAELNAGRFEILLGVCDAAGKLEDATIADAAQLARLPNSEQAYVIRPIGDNRLVLTALDPRGVYYAARTLHQLLESSFDKGKVTMPLATVTDWPDLAERGEWGGTATRDIVWMAHLKMNVVESHIGLSMTKDGHGTAKVPQELIDLSRRHALKFVPIITHLNGIARTGIYDHYPELRGKGKAALMPSHPSLVAPCCSHPKFAEVLAEWMVALASHKGVSDVCAWLSECNQRCECDQCAKVGQWAFEARRFVEAWRIARRTVPHLRLRILLTQGSYTTNDKVLAEIPPEVGVSYYDGGRTYDSSRDPMIYPLLADYAAKGRWLGCYPQLTASWRIVCPWSGPQFIKYRMTEFVEKKMACLAGYATPNNRLYEFNIVAAAEWSWNAFGRNERDFALAWATRRGLKDPEAAAEWAVMLGPVGWDVYGSGIPFPQFFGRAAGMVASGGKPVLGERMFRYFPTVEHIDHDLALCDKAIAIATRLGDPAILAETRIIQGYVQMVKAIYAIASQAATPKKPTYAERVAVQNAMTTLAKAGMHTARQLKQWEAIFGQGTGGSRLLDSVDVTEKTVVGIGDALEPLGIRNALKPYLRRDIGKWETDEFQPKKQHITKTFEVTDRVLTPGAYEVGFKYTGGWWGLGITRVALASAPADNPKQLTELSVDEHTGSAGARNKDNIFTVQLKRHDANCRYFIVANVHGNSSADKRPDRRGCNGEVWMQAVLPADWEKRLADVRPLTDTELLASHKARFGGKGLRVAVMRGGYGSEAVLASLRKTQDIDAQPISALYPDVIRDCQVIVLPQSRSATPMGKETVQALEGFVRAGGGLITTHNAVGYRGHALLLTDVCARGLEHVRDTEWLAVATHPLTAGIDLNKPLPHAYYDHIELEAGPKGTVVAQAAKSKRPVVICGDFGKGRYVACGLAIGLNADTKEATPEGAERLLLQNAVRWCGKAR